ncbi:hypothetical protein A3715_02490 [Oleiphilus sp. HI0009]|nr:hypothetical protein A3715_02490 [Oleiphilus sp. HI0009]
MLEKLKDLLPFIALILLMSGCAVSYQQVEVSDDNYALSFTQAGCSISPNVQAVPMYQGQDMERIDLEDYVEWTNEIIEELGCSDEALSHSTKTDSLNIEITDASRYQDAGIGYLAALTLYLVPLSETYGDWRYRFELNDDIRTAHIKRKLWLGWYFLPLYPLSFLDFSESMYKDELRKFLIKNN